MEYVLSVLGFTYPTVYQGWQTFVGAFMLVYLRPRLVTSEEGQKLTVVHFFTILPSLMLHVSTIVSASKSLSAVPVPLFLSAHNAVALCVLVFSLKNLHFSDFIFAITGLASSFLLFLICDDLVSKESQVWTFFYVLVATASDLVDSKSDSNAVEITKLYYKNIFSFVFLAPCSLYLGEAFTALNFRYLRQVEFYFGCCLSGVAGIFLQLVTVRLARKRTHHFLGALVKFPAILISLFLFDSTRIESSSFWLLLLVNIMSTAIFTDIVRVESPEPKTTNEMELLSV